MGGMSVCVCVSRGGKRKAGCIKCTIFFQYMTLFLKSTTLNKFFKPDGE